MALAPCPLLVALLCAAAGASAKTYTVQWTFGLASKPLRVPRGSRIFFTWNTGLPFVSHDLWLLPGPAAFQQCSFAKNKKLKQLAKRQSKASYTTTPLGKGVLFFACSVTGHCSFGGQKLQVTVT